MVDDWLLEHLAKVTTLSCVLIVIYFLLYSIWRISQMPNYPWNWNDWQWPIGGRHAVEIYRKPTEMPFTLSLEESTAENINRCTFTINYLKEKIFPEVTVMWGPGASYLMRLINLPWREFNDELMRDELQPGEWKCLIDSATGPFSSDGSWMDTANYFILQRLKLDTNGAAQEASETPTHPTISNYSVSYISLKFELSPPITFDWGLLRNQFRYPAAIFVIGFDENLYGSAMADLYEINGLIQIVHVKNEIFKKSSAMLAQYIKMNNGQSHVLQPLYVMDEHRTDESESEGFEENDGASTDNAQNPLLLPENERAPFSDVLCSVCQVSPVTRVIIPCRHVCLCTQCFEKLESCPICRGHIMYYFKTRQDTRSNESYSGSQHLTWWQKMERFNERFSEAMGLIRQY